MSQKKKTTVTVQQVEKLVQSLVLNQDERRRLVADLEQCLRRLKKTMKRQGAERLVRIKAA